MIPYYQVSVICMTLVLFLEFASRKRGNTKSRAFVSIGARVHVWMHDDVYTLMTVCDVCNVRVQCTCAMYVCNVRVQCTCAMYDVRCTMYDVHCTIYVVHLKIISIRKLINMIYSRSHIYIYTYIYIYIYISLHAYIL